ncbi:MAG: flagellar export chaperone FliS [Firmicutes bacterium]|nr:flagellar export chaperone FliS [Bacillota bacterium]
MLVQNRTANPYRQYLNNQVFTSSPAELIVMLFDGALRFVRKAGSALERQEYDEAHFYLDRTQQIITELSASLDFNRGELPKNLFSLYEYMHHQLLKTDIGRNSDSLNEVEGMLLSLRKSWAEAGRLSGKPGIINNREDGL